MIDVLFTHSYLLRLDPKQWEAGKPYPPLGTIYAAAHVRGLGYSVALHDSMLEESEFGLEQALDRHLPSLLVIYDDGFNYLTKMCLSRMRAAALAMVTMATRRGVPVIVSSSDATDDPAAYLAAGATLVLVGEGEITLGEATRTLIGAPRRGGPGLPRNGRAESSHPDWRKVAGLAYRGETGEVARSGPRPLVQNLDLLLPPAWDLIDIERYRKHWIVRHGRFSLNVSTTRGCPYQCNWCAKPIYGQRYTLRTPASVAAEWSELKRSFHPDHLWVTDDIFGLKPQWVSKLRDELIARDAEIPFTIQARVDLLDDATVQALAEAGCEMVWVGAESGSQGVLDAMEKGTRIEEIEAARARLKEAGIRVGFFLQFGYPGEGWEEIGATLRMVRRLMPEDIGISVSYPLPGTDFHQRVHAGLGEKRNWVDSDDLDPMYPSLFGHAFYRALHRRVHAEFRARKGLELLRRAVERRALGARDLRAMASAARHAALLPFHLLRLRLLRRPLKHAVALSGPIREELLTGAEREAVLSS